MLIAQIQLFNSFTEVGFIIFELLDAGLILITMIVVVVGETHLNNGS